MGSIDLHLGPIIVLAVVGVIALIGGSVWIVSFLIRACEVRMKATITSTDQIVAIDAPASDPIKGLHRVMARAWEGVTENGVRFVAYVPVVQAAAKDDNSEFERDLSEHRHKRPDDWTKRALDMRFFVD